MRNLCLAVFAVLFFAAAMPATQAASPDAAFTDRWIVTLDDAPTLEFQGFDSAVQSSRNLTLPPLGATAPSATGRAFDVLDPAVIGYEHFLLDRQADFVQLAGQVLGASSTSPGARSTSPTSSCLEGSRHPNARF